MSEVEKRRHPRVTCRARVDFGSPREVVLDHEVHNLSLGGVCLRVHEMLDVGAPVYLTLTFPELGSASVDVDGEVVWADAGPPRDIGVRFVRMTPEDRDLLRRYVQLHLT